MTISGRGMGKPRLKFIGGQIRVTNGQKCGQRHSNYTFLHEIHDVNPGFLGRRHKIHMLSRKHRSGKQYFQVLRYVVYDSRAEQKTRRMETALKMLAAKHDSVRELMPDVEAWTKIKETVIVLEPLERATKNLSGSLYPTIADVRFYFNEICDHLKYCVERKDGFGQYMLAASINEKLKEYWLIIDNNTTISSILDPRNKISLFEPGEPTTNAIAALREQFSFYLSQKPQSQTSLPSTSSREYFRQLKKRRIGVTAETTLPPSPSPDFAEIERYLALPCDENVEVLL
ncbi:hypothetical protein RhiirA1_401630 [Rhizophagus irregularis]|uniref:hAT-like transposase RNase-H fold domain-containing protein n=1 Tax=Rhizophagus irregularis TaxID=588596 RepID=A0A2N0R1G0_9GLOM|nr:hypothetical protein RhiirA1_401630 [Rhizophagus irregularis]